MTITDGNSTNLDKMYGYLDVKTNPVHFHVARNGSMLSFSKNEVVRFNVAHLNVGNAMNMTTGVFTAPVNGTYHFQFIGDRNYNKILEYCLRVFLRKNKVKIAHSVTHGLSVVVNVHSVLKLKAGDKVDILKTEGFFNDDDLGVTYFTGFLLEEDLKF